MRILIAITAAAPLALLAACGEPPVSQEDLVVEGAGSGLAPDAIDPANLPQPTEDSLETVDFSGSYTMTGLDGSQTHLTIDKEAGTYEYSGIAGAEASGTFERLGGSRIYMEDFAGRPGWFSVADGALYRLADENAPYDAVSAGSVFIRDTPPGGAGAAAEQPEP